MSIIALCIRVKTRALGMSSTTPDFSAIGLAGWTPENAGTTKRRTEVRVKSNIGRNFPGGVQTRTRNACATYSNQIALTESLK